MAHKQHSDVDKQSKDSKSLPHVEFMPEGETHYLSFVGGFWECGAAKDGMSFEYGGNGGGVIKNSDLVRLRDLIDEHLVAVNDLLTERPEATLESSNAQSPT